MTRQSIPYQTLSVIALSCLMLVSCTPSPRYRAGSSNPAAARKEKTGKVHPASRDLDIILRSPLGGTGSAKINSPFGMRTHPSYGTQEFHQGVDFEAESGDDIYACAAGKVTYSGKQKGYGNVVIIDHGKDISTVYAHLSGTYVRKGTRVEAGQRIGKVGVSGNATGSHLHLELRVAGEAVNPLDYMEIR